MSRPDRTRYRLGRKPNDPSQPRVRLASAPSLYSPPASVDLYSSVPADSWGMDGNDGAGDCTFAELDHTIKATEVAAGNNEVRSTADEVLAAYSEVTGYDRANPDTDQGAEMQVVRAWWRQTGIRLGGRVHTIALFAQLDHGNTDLIKWALSHFGPVGLGIDCPESALDQFDRGEPWTVVKGSRSAGGHAISLVGYDANCWYVLTWGRVQRMTPEFFARYVEEAWTQLDQEWVSTTTGRDPLIEILYDLGEQFQQVTGQPNPFPAPGHDPDAAFAAVLHPWVTSRHVGVTHQVATAAKHWLASKGL